MLGTGPEYDPENLILLRAQCLATAIAIENLQHQLARPTHGLTPNAKVARGVLHVHISTLLHLTCLAQPPAHQDRRTTQIVVELPYTYADEAEPGR